MLGKLVASCLVALAVASTAGAASVRPLLLGQIIDDATLAFQGTCVSNRTEREASTGFVVTYTTFAVQEVLKGTVPPNYTIKQIGGKMPDDELSYRVDGVPSFTVGEDYVLLMAGVSNSGFSSPIGLAQGKFAVQRGVSGARVSNGRDFREMIAGMPTAVLPRSTKAIGEKLAPVRSIDLDDFKQVVRAHAGRPQ